MPRAAFAALGTLRPRPRRHERGAHPPHGDDRRLDPGADRHPGAALGARGDRELGPRARGDEARPRPGGLEGPRTSRRSSTPRSRPTTCSRATAASSTRSSASPACPRSTSATSAPGFLYGLSVADAWIRARRVPARPARRLGDPLDRPRRLDPRPRRGGDLRRRRRRGAARGDRRPGPRRALGAPARRRPLREGALDRRARLQVPPARPGRADRVRRGLPAHGGAEGLQARHRRRCRRWCATRSRRTGSRRRT